MFHVAFCIILLVNICKLYRINHLGLGRDSYFFCYNLPVIMWFLFGGGSSSSWCLEWAVPVYCGTTWDFHIIIYFKQLGDQIFPRSKIGQVKTRVMIFTKFCRPLAPKFHAKFQDNQTSGTEQ